MKNKDRKTNIIGIIKILIIAVLILCLLSYLSTVFSYRDEDGMDSIKGFYKEKRNTLDGVYIGSSAVYRYWIPTQAYERNGMCIYNVTSAAQPVCLVKYLIKETLKTQPRMEYIIIELRNIIKDDKLVEEAAIRRATDSMKDSKNRKDAIDACLKFYKDVGVEIDYNKENYYYKILKYHNMWENDLKADDYLLKTNSKNNIASKYKGFLLTNASFKTLPLPYPETFTGEQKIDKVREDVLKDLLEYCKGLDQKVIFVASPGYSERDDKRRKMNYVMKLCRKEGFAAIDFNQEPWKSRINMDWSEDFYQLNHTNLRGAIKYTNYFSDLLKTAYGKKIDDHRGNRKYKSWDKAAERLKEDIKKKSKENED